MATSYNMRIFGFTTLRPNPRYAQISGTRKRLSEVPVVDIILLKNLK